MPRASLTSIYSASSSSSGASAPDLTGPAAPAPVSLAAGTTALPSTVIGSWSAVVTVTAAALGSDGSTPTVTLTGSGAGPYSVSIASGLGDGKVYRVTLTGTGADGQVAVAQLSVAVQAPVVGSLQWEVLTDWDFTTVDTAAAFTANGALALTTGGGTPFLTITTYSPAGSGTGSITPTNGVGLVVATTSSFQRSFYYQPSMAGITQGLQRYAVEWIHTLSSMGTNGLLLPSLGNTTSINSGQHYGQVCVRDFPTSFNMRVRNRNVGVTTSGGNVITSTTLFAAYRSVQIVSPGGGRALMEASSTPAGPESSGVSQYSAVEFTPTATPPLQNPFIHVHYGVAATTATLTRIRLWREVVS